MTDIQDKLNRVRNEISGSRLLEVVDNFDVSHPLDTVVKTTAGKTAYGFIPYEIANEIAKQPAPVIVTEELFDHLDIKGTRVQAVAQRGFEDMRDAVEYALQKPEAVTLGGGDGSFNIFFKKEGLEKGLMYANLMFSEEPVPAYIVRSISPTGKIKGEVLYEGASLPTMIVPEGFNDKALKEKIESSAGNRVSGKTWNKGNVMKALRMHAQENKYPTTEEINEIKQWIADGKVDHLTEASVGMYIKQALEQKNCDIFFDAGRKCDVWMKIEPRIVYVMADYGFLDTMCRADNTSVEMKSAIILSSMIDEREDDKAKKIKNIAAEMGLQGKELATAVVENENNLCKFDISNAEKAYKIVESIAGSKFENTQMLDDVLEVCKLKNPSFNKEQVGKYCHLVVDAVKNANANVDIKSMSPEERKEYFGNKEANNIAAVRKAFNNQVAIDYSNNLCRQ